MEADILIGFNHKEVHPVFHYGYGGLSGIKFFLKTGQHLVTTSGTGKIGPMDYLIRGIHSLVPTDGHEFTV